MPIVIKPKRSAEKPLGGKTAKRKCVSLSIVDNVELLTRTDEGASVTLCGECGVGFVHFSPGHPNSGKKKPCWATFRSQACRINVHILHIPYVVLPASWISV
jgi:hypothetical protein